MQVYLYDAPELIEVFASEEQARTVMANLFGKPVRRDSRAWAWQDDEDFPDLIVRPLEIR